MPSNPSSPGSARRLRRIAIVAGEASGDRLGAELIEALRARHPGLEAFGMAGPRMAEAGCRALAYIDELAVMGLVEVVRHYPRLRRLQTRLIRTLIASRPDVVIGIDVPDFTLEIERRAKAVGIPTVHYVCPQVWAWRAGRLPAIRAAVDLILALFPFEVPFLAQHGIEAVFVGHPLADRISVASNRAVARASLLPTDAARDGPLLAVLPGSRRQELTRHAALFVDAALLFAARHQRTRIVCGAVDPAAARRLEACIAARAAPREATLEVVTGRTGELLAAADLALLASGTVSLEAALYGTPGVVAYRLAPLSWWWLKRTVRVPHVALPNLLLGDALMPELLQRAATPDTLAGALAEWLADPARVAEYRRRCRGLRATLAQGASAAAAAAIERLVTASGRVDA